MSRIFDIDTSLWRTFVCVSRVQSITVASGVLCKTVPAVSMQIKRLEELLSARLFTRSRRGLILTAVGEQILITANQILAMNDSVFRSIAKGRECNLRFGLPDDYSAFFMSELLRQMSASAYSEIMFTIACKTSKYLIEEFNSGNLDMALITSPKGMAPNESQLIREEDLIWVGERQLLNRKSIPLAFFGDGCVCRTMAIDVLENANIDYAVSFSTDSNYSIFSAIEAGVAIGVCEASMAPTYLPVINDSILPALGKVEIRLLAVDMPDSNLLCVFSDSLKKAIEIKCYAKQLNHQSV